MSSFFLLKRVKRFIFSHHSSSNIIQTNVKYFIASRTLLFGVCPTISTIGPLHGMLGGRFILLFFTCLSFLFLKANLFSLTIISYELNGVTVTQIDFIIILLLAVQLMPQFFLSLFSTIGFSKESLKLVFQHPALLLMPSGNTR